jgi:hypothetical protein
MLVSVLFHLYIDTWLSLIPKIIIINTVNSMLRIYYTTECICNRRRLKGCLLVCLRVYGLIGIAREHFCTV